MRANELKKSSTIEFIGQNEKNDTFLISFMSQLERSLTAIHKGFTANGIFIII